MQGVGVEVLGSQTVEQVEQGVSGEVVQAVLLLDILVVQGLAVVAVVADTPIVEPSPIAAVLADQA
jgi:hypothetical protein